MECSAFDSSTSRRWLRALELNAWVVMDQHHLTRPQPRSRLLRVSASPQGSIYACSRFVKYALGRKLCPRSVPLVLGVPPCELPGTNTNARCNIARYYWHGHIEANQLTAGIEEAAPSQAPERRSWILHQSQTQALTLYLRRSLVIMLSPTPGPHWSTLCRIAAEQMPGHWAPISYRGSWRCELHACQRWTHKDWLVSC